ncbi:MAG: 3-isopropylmalate dehydrogenase [Burkholderiales bacterium]|jgi:3-isopropylmalate dehydrogenase|nr:3-isopropylmalate dehydrogenase [Burkholderiales bacterium]
MKLLVLSGDGIGPEITAATLAVLDSANRKFRLGLDYEARDIGLAALKKHGTTLPGGTLERAREVDGAILGPLDQLRYPAAEKGGVNVSAAFRVKLDLYANVRPARSRAGLGRPMDLVIMRECTEGFYPDRNMHQGSGEFMPVPGVALSVRKITAHACERIARRAFELARKRRRLVTAVHKANVFHVTDGLYLDTVRAVAREFADVRLEEEIVDAMAAKLVRHPERYDVVLATNFYADILSDLASELSGSLGLAGSILAGEQMCAAQAQHGSAPDIAGQDRANPTSLILSAAMLLEWIGEKRNLEALVKAATAIDAAIDKVLAEPAKRTADLGGKLGTRAFGEAVAAAL